MTTCVLNIFFNQSNTINIFNINAKRFLYSQEITKQMACENLVQGIKKERNQKSKNNYWGNKRRCSRKKVKRKIIILKVQIYRLLILKATAGYWVELMTFNSQNQLVWHAFDCLVWCMANYNILKKFTRYF